MIYQQSMQRTLNTFRFLLALCVNLLLTILVFYGIGSACLQGYHFCYEIFGSVVVEDAPGTEQTFQVMESDTMWEVAERLEQEDLIVNRYSFYIRTKLMDPRTVELYPGEYVLNTSMTYEEIINQLTTSG
ncbi:MAG: endolytic transglycosylase MltG [Lachnospiraceae bacterium]|nr:endolytic transglycosylase MltG [Lachnospiraceae bacterium]